MPQRGRQLTAGYAKEGTRLTAESTASKWLPYTEFTVQSMNEYVDDTSAIGNLNAVLGSNLEHQHASGNISGKIRENDLGYLFYHLFGSVTTTSPEAGVYQHVFNLPSDIAIPTMTLFFSEPETNDLTVRGCIVNSLELSAEAKGDSTFSAGIVGILQETVTSQTPSFTDSDLRVLQSRHAKFYYADTLAGLASGTEIDTRSLTVGISTNGESDGAIGNLNPVDVFQGEFTYTMSGTALIKTTDFYDWKNGNVKKAYKAEWKDTGTTIGAANNPTVRIEFPPCEVDYTRENALGDVVSASWNIKPRFNASDATQCRVTIINTVASY